MDFPRLMPPPPVHSRLAHCSVWLDATMWTYHLATQSRPCSPCGSVYRASTRACTRCLTLSAGWPCRHCTSHSAGPTWTMSRSRLNPPFSRLFWSWSPTFVSAGFIPVGIVPRAKTPWWFSALVPASISPRGQTTNSVSHSIYFVANFFFSLWLRQLCSARVAHCLLSYSPWHYHHWRGPFRLKEPVLAADRVLLPADHAGQCQESLNRSAAHFYHLHVARCQRCLCGSIDQCAAGPLSELNQKKNEQISIPDLLYF